MRHITPLILITFALFSACEDKTGNLGLDILPSDDLFEGTDSSTFIQAKNISPGRIRSDDASYAIIGNVDDEFAGQTNAEFITQINTGEYIDSVLNKGEDYFVDSLVLNLAYRENWWFGDKDAEHNITVYRMTSPLSQTETYYSDMNTEGLYDSEPIGERISSGWDAQPDSVWEDDDYVHQWQFRLDDELAHEIFNYPEETLDSREAFREAFAGILVRPELVSTNTPGSLITLDLLSSDSNMELFYSYYERNEESGEVTDTVHTSYTFPINKEAVRINLFDHDHSESMDFNDPSPENLVAQGMAGSYVEIDLEESIDFEKWEDMLDSESDQEDFYGISAVNLYFKADTTLQNEDTTFYSPTPQTLRVYELDEEGNLEEPVYETGQENDPIRPWFAEGSFNDETGEYRFRLVGEYFRRMVENPELRGPYYLASPQPVSDIRRIMLLNNSSGEDITPHLQVKYVNIDKQ
ncbi:MAG: DUF4270 family protein [Marinilabilia sp.]